MAGTPAVELAWSPPPEGDRCIDAGTLRHRVEQIVGHRVFVSRGQADAVIRGSVARARGGRGWIAVVEARSAGDTVTLRRELALSADDCHAFDEAIVLVVALMVDTSEQQAPLVLPSPAARAAVAIGPDVAVSYGMLPGIALGFGLVSEVLIPPLWPVAVSTHFWPTSDALQGSSGGQLGAWTVGAALCPLAVEGNGWGAYGCAGVTGGALYANGVGLDVSRSTTRPYGQAGLLAGLRVRIAGPLFVAVEVEGAVPFPRDSYTYEQADGTVQQVFRTAAAIPLAHARVEVRVP